jgi:hypothetical protein
MPATIHSLTHNDQASDPRQSHVYGNPKPRTGEPETGRLLRVARHNQVRKKP